MWSLSMQEIATRFSSHHSPLFYMDYVNYSGMLNNLGAGMTVRVRNLLLNNMYLSSVPLGIFVPVGSIFSGNIKLLQVLLMWHAMSLVSFLVPIILLPGYFLFWQLKNMICKSRCSFCEQSPASQCPRTRW